MNNARIYRSSYNRLCNFLVMLSVAILLLSIVMVSFLITRKFSQCYTTNMEGTVMPLRSIELSASGLS